MIAWFVAPAADEQQDLYLWLKFLLPVVMLLSSLFLLFMVLNAVRSLFNMNVSLMERLE